MLEDMSKSKPTKSNESGWNFNKPDGWKAYNKALEDAAQGLESIV